MRRIICMLLLMITVLAVRPLFAVEIANYTTVQIPVSDESPQTLQKILPQALAEVLIKVSGNSNITSLKPVRHLLNQANNILQSYRYIASNNATATSSPYIAEIIFDQKGVFDLLQQAGQNVWVSNRPLTLVWLQMQGVGSNTVLSNSDQNAVTLQLKQDAERRGIPYILPTMDAQDQTTMNSSNTSNTTNANNNSAGDANHANIIPTDNETNINSADPIATEARRYQADVVLQGTIRSDTNYQAQWTLLLDNQPIQWSDSATQMSDLVTHAMDHAADLIANQFVKTASTNVGSSDLQVIVLGINNLSDYVNVVKKLQSFPAVSGVSINNTVNSNLSLTVKIQGDENDLLNAINNDSSFSVIPNSQINVDGVSSANLYLRWQSAGDNGQNNSASN